MRMMLTPVKLCRLAIFGATFVAACLTSAVAAPIVHPGDTLGVKILNYSAVVDDSQGRLKDLEAGNVTVAADGSISIPVIGTVHVAGRSTSEIGAIIASRLVPYVRDPAVNVRLLQQGQTIFLTGATTGTLPFLPGESLASALGQLREQLEKNEGNNLTAMDKNGGTLTRSALDIRNVVLQRDSKDHAAIDGEQLLRSGRPGPSLEPDDTLVFASKPVRVEIKGEVAAPGPIYLYGDDTLEQALQEAGGALATASTQDASLIRNGATIPVTLAGAGLREVPQNNDTLIVRAAPHVTVIGQVPNSGEYTLKNGSTLLNALYVAGGPTKWANVRDVQVVHTGQRTSYDLTNVQHGDVTNNVPLTDGDVVYVPEGHKIDASLFLQGLLSAVTLGTHL